MTRTPGMEQREVVRSYFLLNRTNRAPTRIVRYSPEGNASKPRYPDKAGALVPCLPGYKGADLSMNFQLITSVDLCSNGAA